MKIPVAPASLTQLLREIRPETLLQILTLHNSPLLDGRYLHWDALRHRPVQNGLTVEQLWTALKIARQGQLRALPHLLDKQGRPMQLALPEPILRQLSQVDRFAAGQASPPEPVITGSDRDRYIFNSLMEESITSSQLEGASTTRIVAEEMLRAGRQPRDHSEQMIFNNFQAMQWVRQHQQEAIRPELILELHRVVSENTLEDMQDAGRLRRRDDVRVVDHRNQTVLHEPPPASTLAARLERLCAFANGEEADTPYVPPVLRAILLHFMMGYDHPFVDGNGRTARALFYWSMLRQGYWLTEYLSISEIIKRAPAQYARAFLYVETDDNDTTYFLLHQLEVIGKAMAALSEHLARKRRELRDAEHLLQHSAALRDRFNHRQLALLTHALKHPGYAYLIAGHQRSHRVTYATARADLLDLAAASLLEQGKRGRSFLFRVPEDLRARIS
ncbi:Fic family protein [Acidithiobacillus sp. IBUN Pt1247-S3]|uniref:Fic family protein n=1 Tax=Acidithiobacillus sp. IBUN Pt1247-S3 TaxID=3166642 RepID=UPI0034E3BFBB